MGKPAPRLTRDDSQLPTPQDAQREPLGIYIHIPFCSSICNYCNFNRGLYDEALKTRYVEALRREIARPKGPACKNGVGRVFRPGDRADTIFFGGGTPSLLDPSEVAAIIHTVRETFDLDRNAEITLETNPETVDRQKLEQFRAAGVNRLSFGVQSFQDEELRRLGRIHNANRARTAVRQAREAGFDNVSLDLMMWLPGQSVDAWLQNVVALIDANPDHASLYLLELYPNAPLKEEMARSGWSLAPDDDAAEMYLQAMERLDRAGLMQYEISNVARPGRASRHNLKYWTDGEWLGFGCGAHSTLGGPVGAEDAASRWKNIASAAEYIERVARNADVVVERRVLTRDERLEEALFTGLRLSAGIDMDAMRRVYGVDIWNRYGEGLQPFVDAGRLLREGSRLRLSREGMLMANDVMAVFV